MKKQFAALLTALSLLPTLALAQGILHPAGNQGTGKGRMARNLHRQIRAGNGCGYRRGGVRGRNCASAQGRLGKIREIYRTIMHSNWKIIRLTDSWKQKSRWQVNVYI